MSDVYPFPLDSHQMTGYFSFLLPSIGKALEYFAWFKFLQNKHDEAQDSSKEEAGTGEWIEERLDFWPPYLLDSDHSKIPERNSFLWMLACTIEWNESTWKVIYAATTHGRSLNRLTTQIFDYGGPTILIMSDRNGGIFGAYTTEVWRSKADFREDRTAFLFSLAPHFGIYRATGTDTNHIYLYNNPNPHVQFPVGIGFGGIIRAFRLWINDDLDRGESREICTSFARGKVAQAIMFEVYVIEVWGCGGEKAEIEQQRAKAAKDKEIEKRRKVKKELVMETWDSGPSKYVMDLAGKTGVSDEFLDDVKKIRKMREQQKEEQRKKLNK
uniref:TLDc domain-containing protein n=1 Tax=Arcella intermedia TaxID=1963864 RepID=A0A6B2L9P9_9EUKA